MCERLAEPCDPFEFFLSGGLCLFRLSNTWNSPSPLARLSVGGCGSVRSVVRDCLAPSDFIVQVHAGIKLRPWVEFRNQGGTLPLALGVLPLKVLQRAALQ